MAYVMIAVFQIEELPDVIREFVTSGMVKSVKPAYQRGDISEVTHTEALKKKKRPVGSDRALILEFIKARGAVDYDAVIHSDLGITDKSLAYNLKYLIDRGDLVRSGSNPYKYQIPQEKDK
jgi:hypothetical protein